MLKSSYGKIYANRHLKWEQNFSQVSQLWSPSESWCSRWSSLWICGVFFPSVPPSSPCHVASHGTPSLKWQIQKLRSNMAKNYIYIYIYKRETYDHQEKTVIIWNITIQNNFHFNIFQNIIYFCDQSWIFSIITPVFSVTWSFRNHSDLLLKKHFWLLSMLKTFKF